MFRAIIWIVLFALSQTGTHAENWASWRGPRGDGTSLETNLPLHWNAASNVLWRTELPGAGHASPVVWSNRIFTVTAVAEKQERVLLCFDAVTGSLLWERTVLHASMELKHSLNSHASSTPATDGELVYVAFLDGKQMLVAAYDFSGRQRWLVRPGVFSSMHGFSSSPVLYEDKVIVNGDHDGDSYIVALSRKDGSIQWKTPRQNKTRSYCVPFIRTLAGHPQMVLSGDKSVASYNPGDGTLRWIIDGPTEQFVASPVWNEQAGLLLVTGGYPDHHIITIRPDGTGNVTRTHIAWRTNKGVSYVPSPLSIGKYFLVVSDQGFLSCFDAVTGRIHWQERLGEHHASPVTAGGLVYLVNDRGTVNVIRPGDMFERVAQNELREQTYASPAISGGRLIFRTDRHLISVGAK